MFFQRTVIFWVFTYPKALRNILGKTCFFFSVAFSLLVTVYTRVFWKVSSLTKIQDFFQNFIFIFQLVTCLLVTLHTSRSDAPISVTRPNSTRRFSLQNNCSRRWLPLHLTKISVLRAQFLEEGTKRSR